LLHWKNEHIFVLPLVLFIPLYESSSSLTFASSS